MTKENKDEIKMLKNTIKGCACGILISVLLTSWIISQWIWHSPYYMSHIVFLLLAGMTCFSLKNNSLNYYGISCSAFILTSLLTETIILITGVYRFAFRLIYGMDEVMGAGDGFMILTSVFDWIGIVVLGVISSFIWTFIQSRGQIKSALFGRNKKNKEEAMPMYIIAGLGNPGKQYDMTRHNIGFHTIDYIAEQCGARLTKLKFKAVYGDAVIGGEKVYLVKPQTFMNLSGDSIAEMAQFYKVPVENIIIISDDISLDTGRIRVRPKGSAGGHNGLKSIIYRLNSDNFPRVKMGVGAPKHEDYDLADFVLGRFTKEEIPVMEEAIIKASKAVEEIIKNGAQSAMNKYNGK